MRLQGKISHGKTTVEKLIITPSTAVKSLRSYWRHKKVEINLMEEPKLYIYPDVRLTKHFLMQTRVVGHVSIVPIIILDERT